MPSMPSLDVNAMKRALDRARAAGAPDSVLAEGMGELLGKLMVTVIDALKLFERDFKPHRLDPDSEYEGWTLTVKWKRPTAEEMAHGLGDSGQDVVVINPLTGKPQQP